MTVLIKKLHTHKEGKYDHLLAVKARDYLKMQEKEKTTDEVVNFTAYNNNNNNDKNDNNNNDNDNSNDYNNNNSNNDNDRSLPFNVVIPNQILSFLYFSDVYIGF